MSIEISVIICTYNRAGMLPRVIDSLIQQTLNKASYEIVVVDNNSADNTPQVVHQIQTRHPECNIVFLCEPLQGLNHAKNLGLSHARGAYIAFIDDDAKASATWLDTALQCLNNIQPLPIAIGGRILPFYELLKPEWFKDEYEVRTWGEQPRFLRKGESLSGSNMIFKKEVFDIYGVFDVSVGVKGKYLSLGAETSLFDKIWEVSGDAKVLYYSPQLVVFHAVPDYKLTVSYALKRAFASGQASYVLHGLKSVRKRIRSLPSILVLIVKRASFALKNRGKHRAYQNWIVEDIVPVVTQIGYLAGTLGLYVKVKQR